jgi:hypothetical protein
MKLKSYNILFRIFSFLSDRTNGAPFFVKYKLLLGTLIIGMATPTKAQERVNISSKEKVILSNSNALVEVSGKVIDESGEELIGVTVLIKNTPCGTVTDVDGYFELSVKADDIFVFSYTDFETQKVPASEIIDGKNTIILKYNGVYKKEVSRGVTCYLPFAYRPKKEVITITELRKEITELKKEIPKFREFKLQNQPIEKSKKKNKKK